MLNERRRLLHSSRVKCFVNVSASWFLVSTNLIWILDVQINHIKQPIQRNAVGSGHVSRRRTSALHDHFDHSLIVFKNVQLGFEMRKCCACDNVIHIRQFITSRLLSLFDLVLGWCFRFHCVLDFSALDHRAFLFDSDLSLLDGCSLKNAILLSPHPTDREQGYHPCANQHPEK